MPRLAKAFFVNLESPLLPDLPDPDPVGELIIDENDGTFTYTVNLSDIGSKASDIFRIVALGEEFTPTERISDDDYIEFRFTMICFAVDTEILTDKGKVPIQKLAVGDMVLTRDRGFQPLRWIGRRVVGADELRVNEKLYPIVIGRGALGENSPERDLRVSPQHRVLIKSVIAERMFETDEVLVAAHKLLSVDGIDIDSAVDSVEYFHLLFDRHEIIVANGTWSESLLLGKQALMSMGPEYRQEISALFPEVLEADFTPMSARPILKKGRQTRRLADRHKKNGKHLTSMADLFDLPLVKEKI